MNWKYLLNAKQGPMAYMNSAAILGKVTLIYFSIDLRVSFVRM